MVLNRFRCWCRCPRRHRQTSSRPDHRQAGSCDPADVVDHHHRCGDRSQRRPDSPEHALAQDVAMSIQILPKLGYPTPAAGSTLAPWWRRGATGSLAITGPGCVWDRRFRQGQHHRRPEGIGTTRITSSADAPQPV
ncbi:hypothetical protein BZL30_5254 [Mycobacterium kansasii]|uniref:Uncharacterized protein n=1 Tax=Mycobacterium kansasii TaxID=1768 RepID=A0A1V3X247_MYCKA|nr:hypothetical protein BZL30_5254 [Mycobacterium kansasii]